MNFPKTIKTKLYLYFTNLPGSFALKLTDTFGMEQCGWVLLDTFEPEIDISEVSFNIIEKQRAALEAKKQEALEKFNVEINAIDDHLASLVKMDSV